MHAARFVGAGRIRLEVRPVPVPGPGQLLVRVGANALCGSERGQFLHGASVTPGHEAAGVVAAAGPGTRTAVGAPRAVFLMDFCGECRSCRLGHTNQCLDKRGDLGFNRDGGYAEYEAVSESAFFPTGGDLSAAEATLLLDIMGTGGHAIGRGRQVRDDIESVLVAGAGPIGLGVLAMAKLLLGEQTPVVISDMAPYRLALAERLGGLPLPLAQVSSLADGLRRHGLSRCDLAVDTSGKAAARQAAIEVLGQRGALVCVGHGEGLNLDVSRDLIAPERAVLGSEYFRFDELPANLDRLRANSDNHGQINTHRFPLGAVQQAFDLFFRGETGKVLVEP
jgi:threonine dehydrogenase-like Zn-dependent dehydrogenase